MTDRLPEQKDGQLQLAPESVEALAHRLAELLAPRIASPGPGAPRRLLSAAEVSRWWGVERSWVYAHAEQLAAHRLGSGPRPRLRFDPDQVAQRLGVRDKPSGPKASSRRGTGWRPLVPADSGELLPIRGDAELSSPHASTDRPGAPPTPRAAAPKTRPSAR